MWPLSVSGVRAAAPGDRATRRRNLLVRRLRPPRGRIRLLRRRRRRRDVGGRLRVRSVPVGLSSTLGAVGRAVGLSAVSVPLLAAAVRRRGVLALRRAAGARMPLHRALLFTTEWHVAAD